MVYLFGAYRLDPLLPLLLRDGETVAVPLRALAGLVLLVQRRHTAVSKRELMEALWPDSFVEEGSLAQLISTLRKVLSADFPDGSPIQTIPKLGYRFVAQVQEVQDSTISAEPNVSAVPATSLDSFAAMSTLLPEEPLEGVVQRYAPYTPDTCSPLAVHPDSTDTASSLPRAWQTSRVTAVAMLLLVSALTAAAMYRLHRARHFAAGGIRAAVAVLPFQDLSGAPDSAWISVAAQEMLSTDLRLSRGFRVLASEEVNRAMDEIHPGTLDLGAATLRRLGADLRCDHAVLGAYLQKSGHIRLDIRVVNLQTGTTEQENTFDVLESGLLPMLAEVSSRTATVLGVAPDGNESARALAAEMDPAAYKLFAEGVARNRVYDFKGAIDLLQQSIAMAPDFPMAHEELSKVWSERGQEKQAVAEAERALQLSMRLPREQQLSIQGRVQSARHQFSEAAETYRTLFSFFPDNLEYGRLLIQSLSNAGRSELALAESQKLLASSITAASDPLLLSVIADMYSTLGNWPASLEWSRRGADESTRRGATILYERLLTTESQANLHLDQYAAAEAQTHEALALARQYHDISGELRALNRLGEIATEQKHWVPAESALLAAVELERTYDQAQRETHTLLTLSRLNQSRGDLPRAYAFAKVAMRLAQKLGIADATTEARLQMAIVNGAIGNRPAAITQLAEVQMEARQIHDAYLLQQAQRALDDLKGGKSVVRRLR